jgi:hypothetical protein
LSKIAKRRAIINSKMPKINIKIRFTSRFFAIFWNTILPIKAAKGEIAEIKPNSTVEKPRLERKT